MTHVFNNLHKEYDVITNGLENYLTFNIDDTLTIEVIRKKINHRYKKLRIKNEEKREKDKALKPCNRQFKGRCCKHYKYGLKPNDPKYLGNKKKEKKDDNKKKGYDYKEEILVVYVTAVVRAQI